MILNKQRVLEKLKECTLAGEGDPAFKGVETKAIANALGLRRNVVSQILNQLVQSQNAVKTKTRPVLFCWQQSNIKEMQDPFNALVGHNGSLKLVVEQCKSAAFYPSGDMPILLTGASGVGKSYIAGLLYEYAKAQEKISQDAPFIVFNCADYAANPELLSANLFGYKKGAFTGAESDHAGTLEIADGGYLFLDEVHRLPPEGQEKFFVFMDKGVFKRLGESRTERKVNVRFIFATTENPQNALLTTFIRRIPMIVNIPSLEKRPVNERLALIYHFFRSEAVALSCDIKVSRRMINYILSQKGGGNIGSIRNLIKFLSACAYKNKKNDNLLIIDHTYLNILEDVVLLQKKDLYTADFMYISQQADEIKDFCLKNDCEDEKLDEVIHEVDYLFNEYKENNQSLHELKKNLDVELNRALEIMVYNNDETHNDLTESLYLDTVTNTLKMIETFYGIKYYGNTGKVITKILMFGQNAGIRNISSEQEKCLYRIHNCLVKNFGKVAIVVNKIIYNMEHNLDLKVDQRAEMIISLYVFSMMTYEAVGINGIIAAHGYSTASSIASVANQMFSQFIFEAFDMPINSSPVEVTAEIRRYLEQLSNAKGTIILVDMGSLVNLDESLKNVVTGDLGIINNITTNIALEVANKILQGENVETILKGIQQNSQMYCKFIKGKVKKKAIVTTCISGIGTAVKFREILAECIDSNTVVVEACEYGELSLKGREAEVFKNYDVRLIISTTQLSVDGVPCILLQDLMEGDCSDLFMQELNSLQVEKSAALIRQDLVKMFSMENILTRLTILNPNKIINEVENIILNYERRLGKNFSVRLKISLYIHISVLIERLMLKQGMEFKSTDAKNYQQNQPDFISLSREIFANIAAEYCLELTLKEIYMLQMIIENKNESVNASSGWDE